MAQPAGEANVLYGGHLQQLGMEAGPQGTWDSLPDYFVPDCAWTLMPPGTTFHGRAEITRFMRSGLSAAAARDESDLRNEFATDEWGVFDYTSRSVIDAERTAKFAQAIGVAGHGADDLAGRRFEIPVCFIYHVNASGLTDRVNEYAAMPAVLARS
jgi:hypothetical protein